jgi:hypothetical protein
MNFNRQEIKIFKKLNTPKKIQDFLEKLRINFEEEGETCISPRFVIKTRKAHCMEGALFAAAALEFHGLEPLVVDLRAVRHDYDHVIAVFKQSGYWGAISKTNHAVLRYREPIYKSIRELVLSFFHEYFDDKGRKNLREYSKPFDLSYFDKHPLLFSLPRKRGRGRVEVNWRTSEKDLSVIPQYLDKVKHYKILSRKQIQNLRKADKIEIQAGRLVQWKRK